MKNLSEKLSSISSPCQYAKWGVDIVGPMTLGKGSKKFLVVAVDYFTKCAEDEALATITIEAVTNFLWKSVVCRYGIPHAFIIDNRK
jgi:hypothetical protein